MQSTPAQIAAGVYNGAVAPTLDFLASPTGLATSAIPFAGQIPARLTQAAFVPTLAKGAYESGKQAQEAFNDPKATTQDVATAASAAVGQGAGALMGYRGALDSGAGAYIKGKGEMGSVGATGFGEKSRAKQSEEAIDAGLSEQPSLPQQYPTNEQGFYSQLQKVIDQKMPNSASVQQIKAIIDPSKGSGVKPDEIKWSNLEGFLEGKDSVTKQEVFDYLRNEGSVKFEERTLSKTNVGPWGVSNYLGDRPTEPKYSKHVLPNGENYKEVVLTMPNNFTPKKLSWDEIGMEKFGKPYSELTEEQFAEVEKESNKRKEENSIGYQKQNEYKSSHFEDTPNYVAHMRLNERKDASGKDGLFIEEIQSDRHQAGRKQGYKGEIEAPWEYGIYKDGAIHSRFKTKSELDDYEAKYGEQLRQGFPNSVITTEKLRPEDQPAENLNRKVADAPFRKDWSVQMFKRALRDAIASGKEWIGWTSGDTQAERYDLSKQVQKITSFRNEDGTYNIKGVDTKGDGHDFGTHSIEKLPEVVGKDLAEKIVSEKQPIGVFAGNDLKVGGEGMKGFYDKILPKEIGKYVKKWGAKVEEGGVKTDPNEYDTTPIWKVKITPEMRKAIQQGQPQVNKDKDIFAGLA